MYRLNAISLVIGLGVSFGLFLVGNFQIPRNKTTPYQDETPTQGDRFIQYIHWIGALFAFFGGLAWMCMHTFISIVLCKDPNKGIWRKKLAVVRFVITLALFCILMAGFAIGVLFRQTHEIKWPPNSIWKKSESRTFCSPKISNENFKEFIPQGSSQSLGPQTLRYQFFNSPNLRILQELITGYLIAKWVK